MKLSILLFAFAASLLQANEAPVGMQLIETGPYLPLYNSSDTPKFESVEAFWMDVHPVSNKEFLAFVEANPKWQRSNISPLFADSTYLRHWTNDTNLGPQAEIIADLPVTHVSWYAARAYAKWVGKRLPSVAEWERVAIASETQFDAREETGYYQRILEWYGQPNQPFEKWKTHTFKNAFGIYDMHGLVWEWVEDFNTSLVTGESRGDTDLDRNLFCGSGSVGTSDFRDYAAFMRFGFRSSLSADYAVTNLGFRCAKDTIKTK